MSKITVKILGGGREVGRAAIAVGSEGRYLLMDYGVNFDENDEPQLPLHIKPSEVSALAVTHAHLDHIGAAPFLQTTSEVPVLMTSITKELGQVMLHDFLKLSGYFLPFEQIDVNKMLDNIQEVNFCREYNYENAVLRFINAGHIPGSSMIHADIGGVKILYTGDVNTVNTKLVEGASLNEVKADILIIEGTYGNSIHPSRAEIEKEFIESVKDVVEEGGNVLVPAFGLGRSQEIMALIAERLPEAEVYFDGMVRIITEIMMSHPEYINRYDLLAKAVNSFKAVKNSGERRRIVKGNGKVIVSSAGMLKGGPAQYYIKKLGDNPKNAVFLVSYQAPNTPGRMLLEIGKLNANGALLKARLKWFDFSSHAGADGLTKLASSVNGLKKIIIVHSEEPVGFKLKERLKELVGSENIYFPVNGDELLIDV